MLSQFIRGTLSSVGNQAINKTSIMSLNKLRVFAIILVFTLVSSHYSISQDNMEVSSSPTPEEMVNILIGGGVTTMNVTYTGAAQARGEFWGGPGNMGVEEGVLLTSGSVNIAPGPNNSGSAGMASSIQLRPPCFGKTSSFSFKGATF